MLPFHSSRWTPRSAPCIYVIGRATRSQKKASCSCSGHGQYGITYICSFALSTPSWSKSFSQHPGSFGSNSDLFNFFSHLVVSSLFAIVSSFIVSCAVTKLFLMPTRRSLLTASLQVVQNNLLLSCCDHGHPLE